MYLIVQFIADVLFIVKVESQRLHKYLDGKNGSCVYLNWLLWKPYL